MTITSYGNDRRTRLTAALLADCPGAPLILLPLPTSRDGTTVSGTDIPLSRIPSLVPPGGRVAGYRLPPALRLSLSAVGIPLLDTADDPIFLEENARLSALGCLSLMLAEEEAAPADLTVGIIGYGRIGRELTRLLLFLGTDVLILTGRQEQRTALGELGLRTLGVDYGTPSPALAEQLPPLTHLINTAPAPSLSRETWEHYVTRLARQGTPPPKLLELASGQSLPIGLPVQRMSSLPDRCFPHTAARLYAASVQRLDATVKGDPA